MTHGGDSSDRGVISLTRTAASEPELLERSGTVGVQLDADGRIIEIVNTTVWQARKDGARHATIVSDLGADAAAGLVVEGTIGCDLVDVVTGPEHDRLSATLRLHSPLGEGELAVTEHRSIASNPTATSDAITIVAPRPQAEFVLYAVFDPQRLPRRCRALVEAGGDARTHDLPLNGDCATHAEFDFGPGSVTLQWDW